MTKTDVIQLLMKEMRDWQDIATSHLTIASRDYALGAKAGFTKALELVKQIESD